MSIPGLLQRRGCWVKVYEQAAAFSRIGAGISSQLQRDAGDASSHDRENTVRHRLASDAFIAASGTQARSYSELPFDPVSEARCGVAPVLPIAMIGISACPAGSSKKMLHQLRERCKGHADGFSCSA